MSFSDFYDAIESPDLRAVAQHWNKVRGTHAMPGWKDIDPKQLRAQLPMLWAYSYDRAGDSFTGRIAGDDIARVFGKKFSGAALSELYPQETFPVIFARFRRVAMQPAFFHGRGKMFRNIGKGLTGERIIMPLAAKEAVEGGVFGATAFARKLRENQGAEFDEEVEIWFDL